MAKKKAKGMNDMAYELYATLKRAIPDGAYMPSTIVAIEYLLADILLWLGQDAKQSKVALDVIGKDVLRIMFKQREMRNQVN